MTAPTVEHLQYRDPHGNTGPYPLKDLHAMYHQFEDLRAYLSITGPYSTLRPTAGHTKAVPQPGWHGPLPAALHAEHVAREQAEAEQRHAAHINRMAHEARRSANPMWQRINEAIDDHGDSSLDAECATDAVMDAVYGEGRW